MWDNYLATTGNHAAWRWHGEVGRLEREERRATV